MPERAYWPGEQEAHSVEPAVGWYLPGGQGALQGPPLPETHVRPDGHWRPYLFTK